MYDLGFVIRKVCRQIQIDRIVSMCECLVGCLPSCVFADGSGSSLNRKALIYSRMEQFQKLEVYWLIHV